MPMVIDGFDGPARRWVLLALLLAVAVTSVDAEKFKISIKHDEEFAFLGLRTWAWHPDGKGDVKTLVTADDKSELVRQRFEPIIVPAVEEELPKRGFVLASGTAPDLYVNYYILVTAGSSSQQMGQFLPAVPEWGLPAMSGAATSFRAFAVGSVVIDIIAPSLKSVVWRGVAQAELDLEEKVADRQKRVRVAIHDILAKFPPKK